jgi:hypothetical protein
LFFGTADLVDFARFLTGMIEKFFFFDFFLIFFFGTGIFVFSDKNDNFGNHFFFVFGWRKKYGYRFKARKDEKSGIGKNREL